MIEKYRVILKLCKSAQKMMSKFYTFKIFKRKRLHDFGLTSESQMVYWRKQDKRFKPMLLVYLYRKMQCKCVKIFVELVN